MGKTRYLFKKIRDTKGIFHEKMGSIKDKCNELVINKPAVWVGGTDFFSCIWPLSGSRDSALLISTR